MQPPRGKPTTPPTAADILRALANDQRAAAASREWAKRLLKSSGKK